MPRTHRNRHLRLALEKLESRALTAAMPLPTAQPTPALVTSQAGQSALIGGGFPADVVAFPALAGSGGVGIAGFNGFGGFDRYQALVANANTPSQPATSSAPSAFDGVGQMTIANGANTIGMMAVATNGISRSGGTGGPVVSASKGHSPANNSTDVDFIPDLDVLSSAAFGVSRPRRSR